MKKLCIQLLVISATILLSIAPAAADNNLVKNPSFENANGSMPADWQYNGWDKKPGATELKYENDLFHSGGKSITIINNSMNDARFSQAVDVKENTLYKLSCWVKTENVGTGQNSKGANISIDGKLETSKDIKGTNEKWEYIEMYAVTGNGVNSIKLTIGLGGYSSSNSGKASFDDVSLEEVSSIPQGAVSAILGNSSSTNTNNSSSSNNNASKNASTTPKKLPGPPKAVWILTAAAVIVFCGGVLMYIKYAGLNTTQKISISEEDPSENDLIDNKIDEELKDNDLL